MSKIAFCFPGQGSVESGMGREVAEAIPAAMEVFDRVLGDRPNQLDVLREDLSVTESQLVDFTVPGGKITDEGLRTNVSVGVRYLDAWLRGVGAAAIDNLMEDAATAEISRAQVWSWVRSGRFDEGRVRKEIELVDAAADAKELFAQVALAPDLAEFLTVPAYDLLP